MKGLPPGVFLGRGTPRQSEGARVVGREAGEPASLGQRGVGGWEGHSARRCADVSAAISSDEEGRGKSWRIWHADDDAGERGERKKKKRKGESV